MAISHDPSHPLFETLEPRLLLDGAVTVEINDGHLYIVGDAADNAVVLTGLDNGGYEITGLETAGGMTTINGGGHVIVNEPIAGRVEVDLGGGDDTLNIGHLKGLDTTVVNLLEVRMGHGDNQLNIGRIDHGGLLHYAGQVTLDGSLSFTNTTFGVGSVLITGAHMSTFTAELGYGEGEREVVIADLWHGLTYHPPIETPADYAAIKTVMGQLTISNPYGPLNATIRDTSATLVDISTSSGDDDVLLRGVDFLDTIIRTYGGSDLISLAESEYADNTIFGLTIDAGHDNDTVMVSNTDVGIYTYIDLERGTLWGNQMLHIAAYGDCDLTDLQIRGQGVDVNFNGIGGVNETFIHGYLDIETYTGRWDDSVALRDVTVTGETTIELSGGNDGVYINDGSFWETMTVNLSAGDDALLVGQLFSAPLPEGSTRFSESAIIQMGRGSDQVAIANAEVDNLLFVNLGPSRGRGQRAQIGTQGTVHAGNLGVAGTGKTNVYIGNNGTEGPSVMVDGILSVSTGMDTSRDTVVIRNIQVLGETGISTGRGTDVVVIQRSEFSGPVAAYLGDGVDVLSIWNCDFNAAAEFYGNRAPDLFWILDSRFAGRARFDGGHGRDSLNRSLSLRNTFTAPDQPEVLNIENPFV